jgi:hypothetical protein
MVDRAITDRASFDRDTSDRRAAAGLLFFKELDCLVELAYRISIDFFDQPQLYRDVPAEIVADLTALRTRYGYQEDFLSREQRQAILSGLFGDPEGMAHLNGVAGSPTAYSYAALRDQVLAAAAAFAERVFDTSEGILRTTVRIMHVYLKDYVLDQTGASVEWSRRDGFPAITDRCYRILRDQQIAARFGVNAAAGQEWPFAVSANGSKLAEQISQTPMRMPVPPISRGAFNDMQQLALRGAEALATVIDFRDNDLHDGRTDTLISTCYSWYAARGRVLNLPVSAPPLPGGSRAAAPTAAMAPTVTLAPLDGNRTLYGSAPRAISGAFT